MTNVAIIGCGYVGKAVARLWRQTLTVTATTTTFPLVGELETIAQRVVVLRGNDEQEMRSLLQDQQIVLLSVGARSAEAYEDTYLQTAKTLVTVLKDTPNVQQVIYTGSYVVYGNHQGAWVDETSEIAPTQP
ncbi:hypothetical protein K9N68_26455 [Kovacikia minuta CCNUW1]|uniref:hypothetical protein n=1 Tax=Kovacikia minuta TaxID=2931930 RepID=UPI001CCB5C23|nr:hypothetical protein K9N68_26455 [Kovacikia minuta CCNUW1]